MTLPAPDISDLLQDQTLRSLVPSRLTTDAQAAMAMSGTPTGFDPADHSQVDDAIPGIDDMEGPANRCTECQWGEDAPVCGCGPHTMTSRDSDGEFCIRCGHAPECHGKPVEGGSAVCATCFGSRVIASCGPCPECQP